MLSRWLRKWSPRLLQPFIGLLVSARITANQLTIAGFVLGVATGMLIGAGSLTVAGIVLLISGLLDALDGELARRSGSASPFGAFFDSITDHYGDFAVYIGLVWHALAIGDAALLISTVCAMFGSLIGSQIRSRAGMLGFDTKDVGIFTRAERIVVSSLALVTGWLTPALAMLAIANNYSALQRLSRTIAWVHADSTRKV